MLKKGSKAPDLEVQTHHGDQAKLSSWWQKGHLILFFYPKDDTRVCTKEACTYQGSLAEFGEQGASVLGCSMDSRASHEAFAQKHGLEFPLIVDQGGAVCKAFEALRPIIRIPKRITYVIGADGIIKDTCHKELSVDPHLQMIRAALGNQM